MVPQYCGGMDFVKVDAMWKRMVMPSTLMLEDICQIFPSSRLHDLGCQRLAVDLSARREGAEHLYHPPRDRDDEENPNVEEDFQILKVISPNPQGNLDDHPKRMVHNLPKYIPVIFGDHDVNNHLSLG